jgi:hypothetical protein
VGGSRWVNFHCSGERSARYVPLLRRRARGRARTPSRVPSQICRAASTRSIAPAGVRWSRMDKQVLLRAVIPPLLFLAVAIGGLIALLMFGEGL